MQPSCIRTVPEAFVEAAFFEFINNFGYLAVAALIFFENVFPPIPSEVILPLAGFLTTTSSMVLPLVIVFATLGSVLGAFVLYGVGYLLSRERLTRFFETRPMKLLGFKGNDIANAIDWFDRKGQITVLICRCVPVVRSLISIPAGTARMNPVRFTLYTLLGSAVWNTILCTLGFAAGSAWEQVSAQAEWISDLVKYALVAIFAVLVVIWVVKRIIPGMRERKAAKEAGSHIPAQMAGEDASANRRDTSVGSATQPPESANMPTDAATDGYTPKHLK